MKKRSGFTLIELLVVIAIIALLMAVLMPALAKVRSQAKAAACLAKLHSWGLLFQMYAQDNGGMLGDGDWCTTWDNRPERPCYREWIHYLRPYYKNDYQMPLCPMATKPWSRGGRGKTGAWGIFPGLCPYTDKNWNAEADGYQEAEMEGPSWPPEYPGDRGSYGMNNWCSGMPENKDNILAGNMAGGPRPLKGSWKSVHVKNAGLVPLLIDAYWLAGSPQQIDVPAETEPGVTVDEGSSNNMSRFCVNRHDGYVNAVFLDFSARRVGLKELWLQKWSRIYVADLEEPDENNFDNVGAIQNLRALLGGKWPDWMVDFKDYFSIEE